VRQPRLHRRPAHVAAAVHEHAGAAQRSDGQAARGCACSTVIMSGSTPWAHAASATSGTDIEGDERVDHQLFGLVRRQPRTACRHQHRDGAGIAPLGCVHLATSVRTTACNMRNDATRQKSVSCTSMQKKWGLTLPRVRLAGRAALAPASQPPFALLPPVQLIKARSASQHQRRGRRLGMVCA